MPLRKPLLRARRRESVLGLIPLLAALAGCTNSCEPRLRKVHTEHLGQMTGTVQNPLEPWGFSGTDLGSSFREPAASNRLILLFGDSWTPTGARWDEDSAAWTQFFAKPQKGKIPKLFWFGGDQFEAIRIPDVPLGGMNVPVEGLGLNGRIYVFAQTGWDEEKKRHCCSALAHTEGLAPEFDPLILDEEVPSDRFINVSAIVEEDTVLIFGSGPYRQSDVFLARVRAAQIGERAAWEYFRGSNGSGPVFGPDETTAQPIVVSSCVGELSVRRHPQLGYLMLYNCGAEAGVPRGIHLRRADHPWGPWDPAINIFDPGPDRGYGYFMHRKVGDFVDDEGNRVSGAHFDDGLAEPGKHANVQPQCEPKHNGCCGFGWREECMGGEYGAYLAPDWFSSMPDGGFAIVYTLSTWVPYQSHLMRTILAWRDDPGPQPPRKEVPRLPPARLVNPDFADGLSGWQSLGDPFVTFTNGQGRSYVTTHTAQKGDAAMGAIFQDFTVDADTKAVRFLVHGGEGTVRLHRGAEIVRESRGRSGHEPRNEPDTRVCWQLDEYAGETLRLAIFDGKDGPWGFIGVTGFRFLTEPC